MSGTFAEQEIIDGYLDGLNDDRPGLPPKTNRSEPYIFGWENGRDDRLSKPRANAETLRAETAKILARSA